MIVIEKLKVLNNVGQKKNNKPFIIPFVPCQQMWTNKFMSKKYICKEALGTLFGYGPFALKTLVSHAKKKPSPIHGLTGGITPMTIKYEENILPSLAHFLKTKIVPLAGARPTQYTRNAVTRTTIERDATDILELNSSVSKRGLYKECAYLHGWKIVTTAKGTIIRTSRYDVVDEDDGRQQ